MEFSIPSININRVDDLELRDALLNMTAEQRRQLGINRNTLWYIKKNLRGGKKIKIYDKVKMKLS
jgi:CRISPR-associated protein Cas1